jgi:hypothetical protein
MVWEREGLRARCLNARPWRGCFPRGKWKLFTRYLIVRMSGFEEEVERDRVKAHGQ